MAAGVAWAIAATRVTCALSRSDPPSRELGVAWLFVVIAPVIVWKEIAAWRDPRG